MSIYIPHTEKLPDLTPIKSDTELQTRNSKFRESNNNNTNFDLINRVYNIVRSIRDTDYPYTIEQLDMINEDDIQVKETRRTKNLNVFWKPSSAKCKFTTQIGLAIRLKLERELSDFEKVKLAVLIKSGAHRMFKTIDKQINDKERVASAKENQGLMNFIETLIS